MLRTHKGTASAQGNSKTSAVTLDSLISLINPDAIDLIKIDVDGFDGKVLLGAKGILRRYSPAVIFEWHPALCKQTGNNWTDHLTPLLRQDTPGLFGLISSGSSIILWNAMIQAALTESPNFV